MADTVILDAIMAARQGDPTPEPFYAKADVDGDPDPSGRRFQRVIEYFRSNLKAPRRERVRMGTCLNSQGDDPSCKRPQPSVFALETRIPGAVRVDGACFDLGTGDLKPGCGFEFHRAGWTNREVRDKERAKDRAAQRREGK